MPNFDNLDIRKKAVDLSTEIYLLIKNNSALKNDFGLKDQIQRSSISIASNIAEGAGRETQKEFMRFLYIARGSCSELITQITIAKNLEYFDLDIYEEFKNKIISLTKMISGMINKVSKNISSI